MPRSMRLSDPTAWRDAVAAVRPPDTGRPHPRGLARRARARLCRGSGVDRHALPPAARARRRPRHGRRGRRARAGRLADGVERVLCTPHYSRLLGARAERDGTAASPSCARRSRWRRSRSRSTSPRRSGPATRSRRRSRSCTARALGGRYLVVEVQADTPLGILRAPSMERLAEMRPAAGLRPPGALARPRAASRRGRRAARRRRARPGRRAEPARALGPRHGRDGVATARPRARRPARERRARRPAPRRPHLARGGRPRRESDSERPCDRAHRDRPAPTYWRAHDVRPPHRRDRQLRHAGADARAQRAPCSTTGFPPSALVVVDNGSTDDSHDRFRAELPDCVVTRLDENVGFARGANAGARQLDGDAYLFVNNDAFVHAPGSVAAAARRGSTTPRSASWRRGSSTRT